MGILDNIVGSLTGSGPGQNQLLQIVTGLITQHGGTEGVVQKFTAHGLGAEAPQRVGNGPNPPIPGDHVQQVFGDNTAQEVASRVGVPPAVAASGLAALLPAVINKLTPNGQNVSGPELESNIAGLLKGGAGGLGLGDLAKLFGQ